MAEGDSTGVEEHQDLATSIEQLSLEATALPSAGYERSDAHENDFDDPWCEDGFLSGISEDDSGHDADALNREWEKRHDQFHKMGYREGITEGKKVAAQEGFNTGFKQSAYEGYKWGFVRGITSALENLPDNFKEKLIKKLENRDRFQSLYSCVKTVSADDALKIYHHQLLKEDAKSRIESEENFLGAAMTNENSLEYFSKELTVLLLDSPDIKINTKIE